MNEVSTGNITDISNSVAKKSGNIVAIQNHLSEDLQGLDKKVKSMMANESEYAAKRKTEGRRKEGRKGTCAKCVERRAMAVRLASTLRPTIWRE